MGTGIPYLASRIEPCRRRITTNSSSRSCHKRRTSHPAVVHEIDDCTRHIDSAFNDVVDLTTPTATVPSASASASPGIGFASSRWKRLL